jgi:hypothetical protein
MSKRLYTDSLMFKWMMIKRRGHRLAVMRFSHPVRSSARFRESTPTLQARPIHRRSFIACRASRPVRGRGRGRGRVSRVCFLLIVSPSAWVAAFVKPMHSLEAWASS